MGLGAGGEAKEEEGRMSKKKQKLGPLQQEWIRCLRSRAWKQTTKKLCRESNGKVAYCCLGVACEVSAANGVSLAQRFNERLWAFDGETATLPDAVVDTLRFHSDSGDLYGGEKLDGRTSLVDANDHGATFKQIADFVEAHPEAVFTGPA
jgi:hypothetical protein